MCWKLSSVLRVFGGYAIEYSSFRSMSCVEKLPQPLKVARFLSLLLARLWISITAFSNHFQLSIAQSSFSTSDRRLQSPCHNTHNTDWSNRHSGYRSFGVRNLVLCLLPTCYLHSLLLLWHVRPNFDTSCSLTLVTFSPKIRYPLGFLFNSCQTPPWRMVNCVSSVPKWIFSLILSSHSLCSRKFFG